MAIAVLPFYTVKQRNISRQTELNRGREREKEWQREKERKREKEWQTIRVERERVKQRKNKVVQIRQSVKNRRQTRLNGLDKSLCDTNDQTDNTLNNELNT